MADHWQNLTLSFSPNPNQLKYLEACLNPEVEANITARCTHAGISRDTFYRWNKNPSFREWLFNRLEELMKEELKEVWGAMLKEAKKGNVQAQKLFLERFDAKYSYRMRPDIDLRQINIFDLGGTLEKLKIREGLERIDRALEALNPKGEIAEPAQDKGVDHKAL